MEMQLFQCPSFDRITSEMGSWEGINCTGRERDVERAATDDSQTTQERDAVDGQQEEFWEVIEGGHGNR